MAQQIHIAVRKTNQYVGQYSHLDKWGTPITAKQLASRRLALSPEDEDMCCGPTYMSRVIAPRGHKDRKEFVRALEDEFSSWGCACAHDCCGCASYSATARHIRGREYSLRVRVSYNF